MTSPAIEMQDVCFAYGTEEILHNITFSIEPSSLVAVVGPNGGGKTTLLRLILGLIQPLRGTVLVNGGPAAQASRDIGYVIQYLHYDPHFPVSVLDVVLMGRIGRHRAGWYRGHDRTKALQALEHVNMQTLARTPFSRLSGGQRQRVLIAQALAGEPSMLLLDEPTANIDAETEQQLFALFREINRSMTIVMVSHNVNVVTAFASHILCVNRTASLSSVEDQAPTRLRDQDGKQLAVLHHDLSCQVIDASRALHTAHRAQPSPLPRRQDDP